MAAGAVSAMFGCHAQKPPGKRIMLQIRDIKNLKTNVKKRIQRLFDLSGLLVTFFSSLFNSMF